MTGGLVLPGPTDMVDLAVCGDAACAHVAAPMDPSITGTNALLHTSMHRGVSRIKHALNVWNIFVRVNSTFIEVPKHYSGLTVILSNLQSSCLA